MRAAYAAAYATVRDLLKTEGEARVWQLVAQGRSEGRRISIGQSGTVETNTVRAKCLLFILCLTDHIEREMPQRR